MPQTGHPDTEHKRLELEPRYFYMRRRSLGHGRLNADVTYEIPFSPSFQVARNTAKPNPHLTLGDTVDLLRSRVQGISQTY